MPEDITQVSETGKKLEHLRRLRGDDKAVETIGSELDHERLLQLLRDPDHNSREDLMMALFALYSGEAYGDYQWQKETGGWTTPAEPTLYGLFRNNYPKLAELSLDPGFITTLPDIMRMLDEGEIPKDDYEAARKAALSKLGKKTLYRGTMLTDEELSKVRQFGMISPLARQIAESSDPQAEFEAKALSTNIHFAIESHFHGENYHTPFVSISEHEDIAIAVGRHFAQPKEGRRFYLFTLEVPAIAIISYAEHGVKMPGKLKANFERNPDHSVRIAIDGDEQLFSFNEAVESYIFWKIDPSEITEVIQPEVKESSWNARKTEWT